MDNSALVYLKPNFVAEPLVQSWYAWAQLISPVSGALYLTKKNIPVMKSYMLSPKAHAAACRNPKMLGGPFIDYNGEKIEEITELYNQTIEKNPELFELAEAVSEVQKLLDNEAKGNALKELYEKIPECLQGYIELVYDLNDNPSIRFFESMFYESPFYKESMQSIQCYLLYDDDRPFVLSTPRIPQEGKILLDIPFKSGAIDNLYKMVRTPGSYQEIKDQLGIREEDDTLFRSFFTEEKPGAYEKVQGDGIRTRYFGHACILIETKDISILVDPVISHEYESDLDRLTYKDLPDEIDYVLITHNHQDHILIETVLQLRHKVKNFIVPKTSGRALQDPCLALMLRKIGFKNVMELDPLGNVEIPDGSITGLPFIGEHGDIDVACKLAYLVQLKGYKIMLLADSDNIDSKLYAHLHKIYGDVDTIFMGMECEGAPMSWLYGALRETPLEHKHDQKRRLNGSNFERGMGIIDQFNPKETYVYAMGAEPWIKYISSIQYTDESYAIVESNKLIDACNQKGIISKRLYGINELNVEKLEELS